MYEGKFKLEAPPEVPELPVPKEKKLRGRDGRTISDPLAWFYLPLADGRAAVMFEKDEFEPDMIAVWIFDGDKYGRILLASYGCDGDPSSTEIRECLGDSIPG